MQFVNLTGQHACTAVPLASGGKGLAVGAFTCELFALVLRASALTVLGLKGRADSVTWAIPGMLLLVNVLVAVLFLAAGAIAGLIVVLSYVRLLESMRYALTEPWFNEEQSTLTEKTARTPTGRFSAAGQSLRGEPKPLANEQERPS